MSKCSKDLDPLFDEIADKAVKQQRCIYGSKEWMQLDSELETLKHKADTIFFHYNPAYKYGKKTLDGRLAYELSANIGTNRSA